MRSHIDRNGFAEFAPNQDIKANAMHIGAHISQPHTLSSWTDITCGAVSALSIYIVFSESRMASLIYDNIICTFVDSAMMFSMR